MQKVEAEGQDGIHQIGSGKKQQGNTLRMFGVNRKVERLLFLNPRNTKRQWTAFSLLPCRALRRHRRRDSARVSWAIRVGKHRLGGIVQSASPKLRLLSLKLPDQLLPHGQRKSQPDPGESDPPESRDRPGAGGAACRLSHHLSPARGYDARD